MHVVAVGMGAEAAHRAATVLKHWTQDGNGQGADEPAGPTKAEPEIRQELARIEAALRTADHVTLGSYGGFQNTTRRLIQPRVVPSIGMRHGTRPGSSVPRPPPDTAPPFVSFGGRTRGRGRGRAICDSDRGGESQKRWGGILPGGWVTLRDVYHCPIDKALFAKKIQQAQTYAADMGMRGIDGAISIGQRTERRRAHGSVVGGVAGRDDA